MTYARLGHCSTCHCLSSPQTDALGMLLCVQSGLRRLQEGRAEDLTLGHLCFEGRSCVVIDFVPTVSGTMPDC